MSVTIKEVAKRAGVSTATVSRVFNNMGLVDEVTRQRVQAVAKELRYTPNAVGRSLSTRRTDSIGLLLPELHGEFFSEVIRGADQAAQRNRYHLLVSSSHISREALEEVLQVMRGRVDGLIIMSPHIDADTLKANLPRSLPVVLLNCQVADSSFDSFNVDNYTGAYQTVKHLREHAHEHVAIIKGTDKNLDAAERLRGYRRAMQEDGRHVECNEIGGDFSEAAGYDAIKRILALQPRPTAIFAANDSMALGALSALRELGVDVPREIALAGFDDIPVARYLSPALTTVHVSISTLGRAAIQRLFQALKEKNTHIKQHEVLPTTLVIRESCGCKKNDLSGQRKEVVG